jgi:ubiquinone/menaquinone biosynthesis C-methylase UbiE
MILISPIEKYAEQERLYIAVRDAEGRVVADDLLKQLPNPPESYIHHKEWKLRAESFHRFASYIDKYYAGQRLKILDIGCGNGWMSHRLYKQGHSVTAIDLNIAELEQAERVFGTDENLLWVYADILKDEIPNIPFDVIVFGASSQYFNDISILTGRLKPLLKRRGSIHLLDTFFYTEDTIAAAQQRTEEYYNNLGYPLMATYYHHHSVNDLKRNGYKKLFPSFFSGKGKPEWWVCKADS